MKLIDGYNCPVCGSKAFVMHDIVDGFGFGWSSGCPRWSLYDPHHPHYDGEPHLVVSMKNSADEAISAWAELIKRVEVNDNEKL